MINARELYYGDTQPLRVPLSISDVSADCMLLSAVVVCVSFPEMQQTIADSPQQYILETSRC